ncbi:unnamed protein product [Eruca vesicaria subsp. sativa]|uniref:Uncharacterized protein n=1 Tax=Eruca vesicaria subsp. sativa TaxID=29727 RepID=A0ABC8M0F5_ERUVS|nr:unnamed protein product [Eruca vesicaria subsp. sativa]
MGRRILNDALRTIVNAEKRGKASVELKPVSTVMSSFLRIMKEKGYIKNFQVHDPHRVGTITVDLQGRVNDCKALTYRQDVKAKEIGQYTERTLPTRQVFLSPLSYNPDICGNSTLFNLLCIQWGYVVVTTPDGILDHEEAIKRNVGGQVLGFFY